MDPRTPERASSGVSRTDMVPAIGSVGLALSPSDAAAIRGAEKALADAFESPDRTAWVDFYTDDSIFVGPGMAAIDEAVVARACVRISVRSGSRLG